MPSSRDRVRVTVGEGCEVVARVLEADVRRELIESVADSDGLAPSLARLRRAMRSHAFAPDRAHGLTRVVQSLDQRTKAEGFHVLESWDFVAHKFADDITPILMLERCTFTGDGRPDDETVLSILLDQYFLSVLGLLVARAWDDPNPNGVFDDVTRLLGMLGESSHRFVDNAATLLILAVSHYHPRETAYDVLIERIATLDDDHRLQFSLACAPVLSGHFRWGLRFMYGRDFGRLRDDNVVDYPWLLFAVRTLVEAYCRTDEHSARRPAILEGLLSGVSADPRAFTDKAPKCFQGRERDHEYIRGALCAKKDELLRDLTNVRPALKSYSPLGFEVNFLCNAHTAMVATALKRPGSQPSLDTLLAPGKLTSERGLALEAYAKALMDYASGGRANGTPALIVYDPHDAQHAYNLTLQVLGDAIDGG